MTVNSPHVAFLVPSMQGGGAERVIRNLVVNFHARGFDVDLLLVHEEGPYLEGVPDGVRVVPLGGRRILTSLPFLIGYLRRSNPDVLLATITETNIIAVWAKTLSRVPTRLVLRVANTPSKSLSRWDGIEKVIVSFSIRFWYPRADHLVTVSTGVKEDLIETFGFDGRTITPIPNPKDISTIQEMATRPLAVECIRTTDPIVLAAGRLVEQKDYPTLIRAFARLRKTRSARLVILGDGPQRTYLESLVRTHALEEDVRLPGFVDNPFAYFATADVFALSSRWEGSPNVLIEALACGTPIVATNCPSGPAEILDNGTYGRLVPVGDVNALCEEITTAIDSPSRSDQLVDRAREYSIDRILPTYESVLFPKQETEVSNMFRPNEHQSH